MTILPPPPGALDDFTGGMHTLSGLDFGDLNDIFCGIIKSCSAGHGMGGNGYGFIGCSVLEGDCFFLASELPQELKGQTTKSLSGQSVVFYLRPSKEGKRQARELRCGDLGGAPKLSGEEVRAKGYTFEAASSSDKGKGGKSKDRFDSGRNDDYGKGKGSDYGRDSYGRGYGNDDYGKGKGRDYGRDYYDRGNDYSRGRDYYSRDDYGKGRDYYGRGDYSKGRDYGRGDDYGYRGGKDYGRGRGEYDYGKGREKGKDYDRGKSRGYDDYDRGWKESSWNSSDDGSWKGREEDQGWGADAWRGDRGGRDQGGGKRGRDVGGPPPREEGRLLQGSVKSADYAGTRTGTITCDEVPDGATFPLTELPSCLRSRTAESLESTIPIGTQLCFTLVQGPNGQEAREVMLCPRPEDIFFGSVKSFSSGQGYGFITPAEDSTFTRDLYFGSTDLPKSVGEDLARVCLDGCQVAFGIEFRKDGKAKARGLEMLSPPPQKSPEASSAGVGASGAVSNATAAGKVLTGTVKSFKPTTGYGFIECEALGRDVWFSRRDMPPAAAGLPNLIDTEVLFELFTAEDGTPEARAIGALDGSWGPGKRSGGDQPGQPDAKRYRQY